MNSKLKYIIVIAIMITLVTTTTITLDKQMYEPTAIFCEVQTKETRVTNGTIDNVIECLDQGEKITVHNNKLKNKEEIQNQIELNNIYYFELDKNNNIILFDTVTITVE